MALGNGGKFALGALIAAAVGYVAGILTAPKSGKETRADIKQAAETSIAEVKKRLAQLQDEISELTVSAKSQLDVVTGKAKEELGKAVEAASHAKEKIARVVKNGKSSDKDLDKALKEAQAAVDHLKSFLTK